LTASLSEFGFGFDGVSQDMAKHSSPPHPANTVDRSFGIGWDKTKPGFAGTGVYFISGGFYAKICFLAGTHSIAAVFDFLVDDGVWG
jgi:hypothetical protein